MSKYLGESEHKIRKLFSQARKLAPCVLFFDELDSIGTKRSKLFIKKKLYLYAYTYIHI